MARVEEELRLGLTKDEVSAVRTRLRREPNEVEWAIIDAEWSEHCSYKSSKALLKAFPVTGKRVLVGPGYDAGVLDVSDGYVVTVHIESHNHPSAIDPYGGAATGIGGVLRDILSMGSRPIALLDILRFGRADRSPHSRWLLRNVVRGIADYGNCVGVPTVAGEIEFDDSFERNCLVDVACIGMGRRSNLILGEAKFPGDMLLLAGGSTGRDGIRGATFASKGLSEDADSERSSVQVPDPFMKKLILDSLLEIIDQGLVRGMKDLGGGGLSSALSELGSKAGTGVDVELSKVNLREPDMSPSEIMISESQERMMLVVAPENMGRIFKILQKYEVPFSIIGHVTNDGNLKVRFKGRIVADLPIDFVANAPLIIWPSKKPSYSVEVRKPDEPRNITKVLLSLLASPNIASKRWVYEQYDHEVGVRTVLKPGQADAAVLKLPNEKLLAVKADGNSKATYLGPYLGAAGCVSEACRNVVATGAEPLAMVDHLQVGDPGDPEVYWAFGEMIRGMAEYCKGIGLPVVGGKVSFYNEDLSTKQAIKPSPIALVVGLIESQERLMSMRFRRDGDSIMVIGNTLSEMGGSEYYEYIHGLQGGLPPSADPASDRKLFESVRRLISNGWVSAVHDCSKGGLAVSLAEMCITGGLGANVQVEKIPAGCSRNDELLFSESHGRFVLAASPASVAKIGGELRRSKIPFAVVGRVGGSKLSVRSKSRVILEADVDAMRERWEGALPKVMG